MSIVKFEIEKGIHPGFEFQDRCHQKSKTGVSVALRKVNYDLKMLKKKNKIKKQSDGQMKAS